MEALISFQLNVTHKADGVGVQFLGSGGAVWRMVGRAAAQELHAPLVGQASTSV